MMSGENKDKLRPAESPKSRRQGEVTAYCLGIFCIYLPIDVGGRRNHLRAFRDIPQQRLNLDHNMKRAVDPCFSNPLALAG